MRNSTLKEIKKILTKSAKLRSFFDGSKTFGGICFYGGCYQMNLDIFLIAFEYYLDTGINVLDEYTEIVYISWEVDDNSKFFDKKKRKKIDKYLRKESFWNIYDILGDNQISKLKAKYINCEEKDNQKKVYSLRRKQSLKYTANQELRKKIFDRDGAFCKRCGATTDLQLDHIIPIYKGGKDIEENLQVLCKSCNTSKGNR